MVDAVAEQLAVDDVGQPSFQAAQGFFVALPAGSFALVVGPAGSVVADLGDGHGVQAAVELPVSGAGEPVADDVAGGDLDRCGSGVGGERRRRAEPVDIADAGQDLRRRSGFRCHAGRSGWFRWPAPPRRSWCWRWRCVGRGDGSRRRGRRRAAAGSARPGLAGSDRAQQLGGLVGVEVARRPAGEEPGEQHVQPVHRLGAGLDDVVAMLDQRTQDDDRLVDCGGLESAAVSAAMPTEVASASSLLRPCPVDSIRTRAASLAGTSTATIWSAASQLFSGAPKPAGTLDRPGGGGPLGGELAQAAVAGPADRHPDRGHRLQRGVHRCCRPGCLVRIDRRSHRTRARSLCCSTRSSSDDQALGDEARRAYQLWAVQTSLEPLPPTVPAGTQAV